ncbi:MAG TPA: M24 family metallopeptidase [Solirubrobacteraceae bacterium]|jgi:Xaa-Pro aminopeptidase|nr:M24 family metallopeptidase [Solirubrobacteraceae bacterium]
MQVTRIAALSLEERTRRYGAVRAEMDKRDLDVLVVIGRDSTGGRGDFRYLASYAPVTPLPHFVVFPRAEVEPRFMSQLPSRSRLAVESGWVKDAATFWLGLDDAIVEQVATFLGSGRIGLGRLSTVPIPLYQALIARFGADVVVDAGELFESVRLVKSDEEIAFARVAAEASDAALSYLRTEVHANSTDREIYSQARRIMHEYGAEYSMDIIGCNVAGGWAPIGASPGDDGFVQAEWTPAVGGYYNQIRFDFAFGEAARSRAAARDVLREAYEATVEFARPGVTAEQLYAVGNDVITSSGFAAGAGHFGHGLGLDVTEGISIEPADLTPLVSGMIFVLHPKIVPASGEPQLLLGGTFLVTSDGLEALNAVDCFA